MNIIYTLQPLPGASPFPYILIVIAVVWLLAAIRYVLNGEHAWSLVGLLLALLMSGAAVHLGLGRTTPLNEPISVELIDHLGNSVAYMTPDGPALFQKEPGVVYLKNRTIFRQHPR